MVGRMGFPIQGPKGGTRCHQRRGSEHLLAKGSPGLPDFVQRHPQGGEGGQIRKRRERSTCRSILLLVSLSRKYGGHWQSFLSLVLVEENVCSTCDRQQDLVKWESWLVTDKVRRQGECPSCEYLPESLQAGIP